MEENGSFGIRSWVFPNQSLKENRVLQFISAVAERERARMPTEREPSISVAGNSRFLDRNSPVGEFSASHTGQGDFSRGTWIQQRDMQAQYFQPTSGYPNYNAKDCGNMGSSAAGKSVPTTEETHEGDGKRLSDPEEQPKAPNTKKARTKVAEVKEDSYSATKGSKKNSGVVPDELTLDLSSVPTPVCSCTGVAQQCYRWGSGGWQSACCTTTMSMYPLPMSQKRRGSRIAGRKMSHGAFRKVLGRLLSEGHSLSDPVDLRAFWAKHGTNKFVTIR